MNYGNNGVKFTLFSAMFEWLYSRHSCRLSKYMASRELLRWHISREACVYAPSVGNENNIPEKLLKHWIMQHVILSSSPYIVPWNSKHLLASVVASVTPWHMASMPLESLPIRITIINHFILSFFFWWYVRYVWQGRKECSEFSVNMSRHLFTTSSRSRK